MPDFRLAGKKLKLLPQRERDFFIEFMQEHNKEKVQEKSLAVRDLECEIESQHFKNDRILRQLLDLMFDFKAPEIAKIGKGTTT